MLCFLGVSAGAVKPSAGGAVAIEAFVPVLGEWCGHLGTQLISSDLSFGPGYLSVLGQASSPVSLHRCTFKKQTNNNEHTLDSIYIN